MIELPLRIWVVAMAAVGVLLGAIGGFDTVEKPPKPVKQAPAKLVLDRWTLVVRNGYVLRQADPFTDPSSAADEVDSPLQLHISVRITNTGRETTSLHDRLVTARVGAVKLGEVDSFWWDRDQEVAAGGATIGPDLTENLQFVWELSKQQAHAMGSRPPVTLLIRDEQFVQEDSLFGNPIWRTTGVKHRVIVNER